MERPEHALLQARRSAARAQAVGGDDLRARALLIQSAVMMHRGEMREALSLMVEADRLAVGTDDSVVLTELAAVKCEFRFFTGSYAEALKQADRAIEYADRDGDLQLRVYARGIAAIVFGNMGVRDRLERFDELLELTLMAGNRWQEALVRNDIACHHQETGDIGLAEYHIAQARAVAESLPGENAFTLAVVTSSHSDIHLAADRPRDALRSARQSLILLETQEQPNPYVFAASIRAELQAQMALGNYEAARVAGEEALDWLGERLPRARAQVLATYAQALREIGRHKEAYDALSRSAELERQSFRELSELQLILERATSEARVARSEADRDWLTGLHNRRFMAREIERMTQERRGGAISVAAIDLDHFKTINDRFGHSTGDRVLVQSANIVRSLTRDSDITVRSGGEEFLVLMPHTDADSAARCATRIHEAIRQEDWSKIAEALTVTASVGFACGDSPAALTELVAQADQRLYEAKRGGRDRVVGA